MDRGQAGGLGRGEAKEWLSFIFLSLAYVSVFGATFIDVKWVGVVPFDVRIAVLFWIVLVVGAIMRVSTVQALGRQYSVHIKIRQDHELVTEGLYRYLAHPMYAANILIFIGGAGSFVSVLGVAAALVLVVPATIYRIRREEHYLLEYFGDPYQSYLAHRRRLVPFIW